LRSRLALWPLGILTLADAVSGAKVGDHCETARAAIFGPVGEKEIVATRRAQVRTLNVLDAGGGQLLGVGGGKVQPPALVKG